MAAHDPAVRALVARNAALTRWAHEDPTTQSERQRRTMFARFERQVDPDGVLTPKERTKRADRLRRAYMADLSRRALVASKARQDKKAGAPLRPEDAP